MPRALSVSDQEIAPAYAHARRDPRCAARAASSPPAPSAPAPRPPPRPSPAGPCRAPAARDGAAAGPFPRAAQPPAPAWTTRKSVYTRGGTFWSGLALGGCSGRGAQICSLIARQDDSGTVQFDTCEMWRDVCFWGELCRPGTTENAGAKQTRLCARCSTPEHSRPLRRLYIISKMGADRTSKKGKGEERQLSGMSYASTLRDGGIRRRNCAIAIVCIRHSHSNIIAALRN